METSSEVVFEKKLLKKKKSEKGRTVWWLWWNVAQQKQQWKAMVRERIGTECMMEEGLECIYALIRFAIGWGSRKGNSNATNPPNDCLLMSTCFPPDTVWSILCAVHSTLSAIWGGRCLQRGRGSIWPWRTASLCPEGCCQVNHSLPKPWLWA